MLLEERKEERRAQELPATFGENLGGHVWRKWAGTNACFKVQLSKSLVIFFSFTLHFIDTF